MTANLAVVPARLTSDPQIAFAFPDVPPGVTPAGSRVLVQFRRPMMITRSGIIIPEDTRDTEKYNTQTAKVVALGPLAFRHRGTGEKWHEGDWCEVGDFVRITKFGGDRWVVPVPGSTHQGDEIVFGIFDDHNVIGVIAGDPLAVKAYL
jgi:co-chaperonin GroES (HSP10)